MDLRIRFNDPDYYKKIRKLGGKRGFAKMDKDKHKAISSAGGKGIKLEKEEEPVSDS